MTPIMVKILLAMIATGFTAHVSGLYQTIFGRFRKSAANKLYARYLDGSLPMPVLAGGDSSPVTETEAAQWNPDILHRSVLKYRMPKLLATNIFETKYEDVKIGDNIDIPALTRITVRTISLATGFKTTTYEHPTETKATIAINKWSYGAFALEVYEDAVAAQDLESLYKQSAIDTVMVKIDSDALAEADNFSVTVGTDNVSSTDDDVITVAKALDTANAPDTDRHMVFHPAQYYEYMKIDKWVNSLYRAATPINSAEIGDIYGLRVWKTTQVKAGSAGHVNFVNHKSALAMVVRKKPSAIVLDDPDTQARKVVYPAIYGFGELRDNHGHEILGK